MPFCVPRLCRSNLGARQVFRRHWPLQAACLAIAASFNGRRCSWLLVRLPGVAAAAGRFSGDARKMSRLLTPQLLPMVAAQLREAGWRLGAGSGGTCSTHTADSSGSCAVAPPASTAAAAAGQGSQSEAPRQQLATCLEVLLFARLLLCYVAPCLALWHSELSSRRHFLDACSERSAR